MRVVLNWHRVQDGSGLTRAGISDPTNAGIYRGDGIHDPEDASFGQQRTRLGQKSQDEAECRDTGRTWAKERYQKVWLGGATLVSMMESPNLGKFHNTAIRRFLNWSWHRRIFAQCQVRA